MKKTIKIFGLILISFMIFYSCGGNAQHKNETIKQNSILTSLAAKSDLIANVHIIGTGPGWIWDFGQSEFTVYGKINSVLKGDLKTGDTIAFTLINENTLDKNKKDLITTKKNTNYILFLSEIIDEKVPVVKKDSTLTYSVKFNTHTAYDLIDKNSGIKEYDPAYENHLKEIIRN
ncbi:MAG: hypothetical protein ACXVPU_06760 [Bacteroidia bacterium]